MMMNTKKLSGRRSRSRILAVSFFELMVVFAVAAILTSFFIYSAQYLVVRTRVSRVKEEHRVLKRALQNYEADYGEFPETASGLHALDGPIAYLVRIPSDPFSAGEGEEYNYVRTDEREHRWLIVSRGPDGDSDLFKELRRRQQQNAPRVGAPAAEDDPNTWSASMRNLGDLIGIVMYDPTNGLISNGDIITTSR